MNTSTRFAFLIPFFLGLSTARGDEPAAPDEVGALRSEVATLRAQLALLEERQQVQAKKTEGQIEQLQAQSQLSLRTGRLGLSMNGFVQTDFIAYRQTAKDEVDANGEPLNEMRFTLRRARLRVMLDYRFLVAAFEIDANTVKGMQVRPQSFEVGVRYINPLRPDLAYLTVDMGLVRTPFGYEVRQSDKERLFLERATVFGAMFPGEFDLGARAFGGWRMLRYAIAGMNGDPIGEKTFPGRDPTRSKDLVIYAGFDHTFERVRIRGAFSAVYGQGFHKGTAAGSNALTWSDKNKNGLVDADEIVGVLGAVAQPSATFTRWATGGDFGVTLKLPRVGDLVLLGEVVYGQNMDRGIQPADPLALHRNLHELGWYAGFTQELTPWAAIGLRYDYYNPDQDARDPKTAAPLPTIAYSNLVVTAAGRMPRYGRLMLEYSHAQKPNGREPSGAPIALNDQSFTIRGEITF